MKDVSDEVIETGVPHVKNQVTLNDNTIFRSHMWIRYVHCRLTHIYIFYFECIKQLVVNEKIKNSDADTVCGNLLLPVMHKSCVPPFIPLPVTATVNKITMASVNHMPHQGVFEKIQMIRV